MIDWDLVRCNLFWIRKELFDVENGLRDKFFGDAVSNALQIFAANAVNLPSYNLDADRGYGWLGWHPAPGTQPVTPPVSDQAD